MNVTTEWLSVLLRIREIPGSDLSLFGTGTTLASLHFELRFGATVISSVATGTWKTVRIAFMQVIKSEY
jgi:hypothetical protein